MENPEVSESSCEPAQETIPDNELEKESTIDATAEDDLYSYTGLSEFTSEIFKIEIGNLPNYFGYAQIRKLLLNLNLNARKIKAIGRPPRFVFATFQNEEDRDKALKTLDGYLWKRKNLTARKASPAADPMAKKRKSGASEDCPDPKRSKTDEDSIELRLKNAVTPFWNVSYAEQLKRKQDDIHKFLMKLAKEIAKVNRNFIKLLAIQKKANHQQCCPSSPIRESPVSTGYRNKCEFTVGRHLYTKEKTVGFRLNAYKEGSMSVAEPDDCINVSEAMLKAVKSFQEYVRQSDKDVYNPENHQGYWRQLTVRTSNNSDVLLIVVMHPQSLTEAELEEEKMKLKSYFEDGPGSSCGVTSVYLQFLAMRESTKNKTNLIHLMGKQFLEETLLGKKFNVAPEAFFQINLPACEVLYSMVADIVKASAPKDGSLPVVLDICCGTGSISLSLAEVCGKVVGVEICPEAVKNAKLNAAMNSIFNVEFICGKAEDVIFNALQKFDKDDEIIAVVDPPRAGLHPKVLKAIHSCKNIRKLIYISCNPDSAQKNFIDLCRPPSNNYKGTAFFPTQAAAVDMFPHTPHKELVLIFERAADIMKSDDDKKIKNDGPDKDKLDKNGLVGDQSEKTEGTGEELMNIDSVTPEKTGDDSTNQKSTKVEETRDDAIKQTDTSMNQDSLKQEETDDSMNQDSVNLEESDNSMNQVSVKLDKTDDSMDQEPMKQEETDNSMNQISLKLEKTDESMDQDSVKLKETDDSMKIEENDKSIIQNSIKLEENGNSTIQDQ